MYDENFLPKYNKISENELSDFELKEYTTLKEKLVQLKVNDTSININREEILSLIDNEKIESENIVNRLFQDINGYGKIDSLIKDDELEEIMIIGSNKNVYVYHRKEGMMITDLKLTTGEIKQIIEKIANQVQRKIDKQTPILDARLYDGSRVNATLPPITPDGPTLTIRKFKKDPLTIFDLIKSRTMPVNLASFLWVVIEGLNIRPSNIIIAGGTGSGKTTTLNTLTVFIPPHERIITIEDTLEMQIPRDHIIRTETRPPNVENKGEVTMDVLLKNSLRQRPDRIIVGEVRSSEAITLFSALNTGHSGMGTLHANSTNETITRLINPPMNVPNIMIQSIDFIIMQNRVYNRHGKVLRRVTEVAEVVGMENEQVQLNKIFKYNSQEDELEYSAISCNALNEISLKKGVHYSEILKEIDRRKKYLMDNVKNRRLNISEVQKVIDNYYLDPDNAK